MLEWTLTHPYLTFTLVLFFGMIINNISINIVNRNKIKPEIKKPSIITELNDKDHN